MSSKELLDRSFSAPPLKASTSNFASFSYLVFCFPVYKPNFNRNGTSQMSNTTTGIHIVHT